MTDKLLRDLRQAVRGLLSRKTYAIASTLTLALVVGAATAVLAVVNATMIRPLPFPHDDRLVQVFLMPPGLTAFADRNPLSNRVFDRFRSSLQQTDAFEGFWARERALGGGAEPESVGTAGVSAGALSLFGGVPMLGRVFSEDEARADARVVVLSHGLWQRRFGSDPQIVGRTVQIDREPFEVIGVMPVGFTPGYVASEAWTPLSITESNINVGSTFIQTFARMRPGVTVPQLKAELDQAMVRVVGEAPKAWTGWSPKVMSLRDAQFGQQRPALLVLLAAVLTLAVIAGANLSNLTLAQVIARRSDFALRSAMGGRATDLVRLQLVETTVLTTTGIVAGLLAGSWMLPVLLALDPAMALRLNAVHIDWRVRSAIAVLALVIAAASAMLPLMRVMRGDLLASVANTSRRAIGSRSDQRIRQVLVSLQTAMAVVLTICGALLLSGLDRASRIDPGFKPEGVLGAQMRIAASAYPTEPARAALIGQVVERLRALPGVTAAGATLNPFIPNFFFQTTVQIEGKPSPDGQPYTVQFRRATPQYFKTMGIPIVRGRDFADADGTTAPQVAMVSQAFADRFWPGEDPIGRRVTRGGRLLTVIGIVGDVRDVSVGQPPGPTIYITYFQQNVAVTPVSLVVRTSGDPLALANAVRSAVMSVDPAQPIDHITTVDQFLSDSLGPQRFRSALLIVLAMIGVVLAVIGVYGVTARAVQERTQELGVRLALGATQAEVVREMIWRAMRSVVVGLAAGAALAAVASTALLQALPDLSRTDAWTAAPAIAILALTAALAATIPARRAAALDPVIALRAD
jgi:putative ABC transport system permease protein